ncbi:thioesterase II family protein [Streptomyces enissocaesilis]|uniref:Alpha/beta fold hydrolase n=1 Tax=Streptomyces enissocaesilis TaxID=332589 RepID=A0ABN3XLK9_9ACTN
METVMNDGNRSTVFFPGAGSFGGELRPLAEALGPTSWLVCYPGRFGRDFGTPAASFDAVVRSCVEQIAERPGPCPVLFGHSYGAYVAYAAVPALHEAGIDVSALVVAGAPAPGLLRVPQQASHSPSAAAEYLDRIDPGVLADAPSEEWRGVVAETTAHDLRLLGEFTPTGTSRVRCPVLAVRGDADPLTSDTAVAEWSSSTEDAFSRRTFPGGHSDFLRSPGCASWLREIRDGLTH